MASSSTEPHHTPDEEDRVERPSETEPLLGRPGDAMQKPDAPMIKNLWLGTGWIAQLGAVLLLVVVWAAVFMHPFVRLFSPHPLLQALGVFTLTQAILVLQPTGSPETKLLGARAHAVLNLLSFLMFASGITIIDVNKALNGNHHFKSVHGILGTITGILLLFQYVWGFLMWGVPSVFGGVDKAKATWKYHRMSGYVLLLLILVSVVTATGTSYVTTVLDIKLWTMVVAVGLIVVGIFPRIQPTKLGIHHPAQ